jgi:hypothetical protein
LGKKATKKGRPRHGEAVVRAGAGVTIADDRSARNVLDLPGAETIRGLAGAVSSVVDDPTYRRAAVHIADAMSALPPVDESVQLLEGIAA